MGATIEHKTGVIWVLRCEGVLHKAELDAAQATLGDGFKTTDKARLLVLAEKFQGWEKGADWGDLSFLVEHGDKIEKIALVADPKWKDNMLVFTGAGFRKTDVQFFPTSELNKARAWLA